MERGAWRATHIYREGQPADWLVHWQWGEESLDGWFSIPTGCALLCRLFFCFVWESFV